MRYAKTIYEDGLLFKGIVVVGDWEGDRNVPYGKHHLPPYVEDVTVSAESHDITEMLTEEAIEMFGQKLIDRVLEDMEDEGPKRYRDD